MTNLTQMYEYIKLLVHIFNLYMLVFSLLKCIYSIFVNFVLS